MSSTGKKILVILSLGALMTSPLLAQEKIWTKQDSCLSAVEKYSYYWKKDKLGKNGAREIIGDFVFPLCEFKGLKWKNLHNLLGEPNMSLNNDHGRIYRYQLNYQSNDIKEIGTMILHIEADSTGTITNFSITVNDG